MNFVNTIRADVVIVGSGLAGLYAALHFPSETQVAVLAKGEATTSNSARAQGGIAAALAADDSPQLHRADTLKAGRGLCSPTAVDCLVKEGPAQVKRLVALGVPFDREASELALTLEGGHSRRRIAHASGTATGAQVISTVQRQVLARENITLYEGTSAVKLVVGDGRCCGVLSWHRPTASWRRFLAPVTLLATGGAAALYDRSTNPPETVGDGVAMAFRAGAAVADMEFVQFHPTALALPNGGGFLISEAVRGEGARLLNSRGERFMPRYHPSAELAPRDQVARGMFEEMKRSGATHLWLDLSSLDRELICTHFANLVEHCRHAGIDMLREPLPVAPAAHYVMGGVLTDLDGKTSLPGLFACGEVACTGVQGANRLASNSLLECLVFGRRSAFAAQRSIVEGTPEVPPIEIPSQPEVESGPARRRLARLMWNYAGIEREETGLRHLIGELERMEAQGDPFLQSSLTVAYLIARGALLREESRGGHARKDFPETSPHWRGRILLQKGRSPKLIGLEHWSLEQPVPSVVESARKLPVK